MISIMTVLDATRSRVSRDAFASITFVVGIDWSRRGSHDTLLWEASALEILTHNGDHIVPDLERRGGTARTTPMVNRDALAEHDFI